MNYTFVYFYSVNFRIVIRFMINFIIFFLTKANAVLYSFAPTIIIFVVNILLFRELTRSKLKLTNIREKKIRMRLENRRLAKTHLFLSLAFLLVSVPRSITIAMFIISRTDFNYFLLNLSTLLSFFYFNSTLFILLAKNPPFKENFFSVLSASSSVWCLDIRLYRFQNCSKSNNYLISRRKGTKIIAFNSKREKS